MQQEYTGESFLAKRLLMPLAASKDEFFEADYNMNLYRGCNHGCIYCDTRSECYRIDRFDEVRYKQNCITMLEDELRRKKKAGIVFLGSAGDPYNALEAQMCITRRALELLRKYGFGIGLTTKGTLVARDAEVLAAIAKKAPARVAFSITTADDGLAKLVEPGAPASSERFAAMRKLADAGVYTGVWLNPMLPFLTDVEEDMVALLEKIAACGGRYVMCHFGMTLRTGNREYFFAALDRELRFAGVKQKYADAFGLDYMCASPHAKRLYAVLQSTCKTLKLAYSFADINRAAREQCPQQLALW